MYSSLRFLNNSSHALSLRGEFSRCSRRPPSDNIALRDLEDSLTYEPFDVVYTWVNGSDPRWKAKKDHWSALYEAIAQSGAGAANETLPTNGTTAGLQANTTSSVNTTNADGDDTMSQNRYRDSEELRFSLRSLMKNAPWIRHIYIVTDNQIPYWLNLETPKLSVISHEEIFLNKSHLPVFSSPAIESNLHRIPGLSKKFIYFNDDVFLGMKVFPEDFISLRGAQRLIMSWDVPKCAPGCSDSWIGDGFCDKACNVAACNFDYPDCVNGTNSNTNTGYNANSRPPVSQAMCAKGCPENWLGDKICDQRCKSEDCAWDVGDCGLDLVTQTFPGVALDHNNARILDASLEPPEPESMGYGAGDYQYGPGNGMFGDSGAFEDFLPSEDSMLTASDIAGTDYDGEGSNSTSVAPALVGNHTGSNSTVLDTAYLQYGGGRGFGTTVKQEPALTVEYGTKAVYFDLAYLPCLHSSNASCVPEQVTNFLYERADHDDEEGRVVHSAHVLSRHHVLVVLLYYGQEGAPAAVTDPVDVKFTLAPLHSATSISHSVTFTLRVVAPAAAAERHPGDLVPSGMALLPSSPAHSCASESGRGRNASSSAYDLAVREVKVLEHPYREVHPGHGTSGDSGGAIVQIHVTADETAVTVPSDRLRVRYTVTELSGRAWQSEVPLCGTVLAFTKDPAPHFASWTAQGLSCGGGLLSDLLHTDDDNVGAFERYVESRGPSRSPRFRPAALPASAVAVVDSANATAPASGVARSRVDARLFLKLPMPMSWRSLSAPAWMHVRAELVTVPVTHASAHLTARSYAAVPHWEVANASVVVQQTPVDAPLACVGAAVSWGGHPAAPSNATDLVSNTTISADPTVVNATDATMHNRDASSNSTVEADSAQVSTAAAVLAANTSDGVRRRLTGHGPSAWSSLVSSVGHFFAAMAQRVWWGAATSQRTSRRLEDTYGASLVHVNRIYNKEFGSEGRKVPAHVPHMIDRDYMAEMQARWPEQWNATSAHRFRSGTDMQYSFSYYYYLINRHKVHPHDLHKYLATALDTDRDGHLNENEFRSVATMVKSSASPTDADLERMRECVANSSTYRRAHSEEALHTVPRGRVRKSFTLELHPRIDEVLNCTEITEGLKKYINWNNMFPTHVLESDRDLVAFEMIGDNYTISLSQLDSVRARQSKFVCINDNMKNPPPELERALRSFYLSFFPEPCAFELPDEVRNPTLYLDEYRRLSAQRAKGLARLHHSVGDVYTAVARGCWQSVRSALLAVAQGVIDAVSGEERGAGPDLYVNGLRQDILREPRSAQAADAHAMGLGRVVLYASVLSVIAFVVLRRLSKRRT